MPTTTYEPTPQCVTDQIMKNKHCNFEFSKVSVEEVKNFIATPICHLFNLNLQVSVCPQAWREANVIPNNSKVHFTGSNS